LKCGLRLSDIKLRPDILENAHPMIDRRDRDSRRKPAERRAADRRETPRHALAGSVRFLRVGGAADRVLAGELLDVSTTGIRLRLQEELQPADAILVEVRDAENRCFNLSAEVVWIERETGDTQEVGCELRLDLTPKQYSLLKELAADPAST
jgi:hypothetical protein